VAQYFVDVLDAHLQRRSGGSATVAPESGSDGIVSGAIVEAMPTPDATGICRRGVAVDIREQNENATVVLVPSMASLRTKRSLLKVVGPAITCDEAEERVLAMGADALDALARLADIMGPSGARSNGYEVGIGSAAQSILSLAAERWAVQQWKQLLVDAHRVDLLEEGGLVVSQWAAPREAKVEVVRARLAELADAVAAKVVADAPIRERVEAVNSILFDDFGFQGNVDNYYDARNSFLHSVLERRRGIPISLSIVWTAVARRVKIPCFLCTDMPAHIVVRVRAGDGGYDTDLYVDAFGRKVMDFAGLRMFLLAIGHGSFNPDWVEQKPAKGVYSRLLRNLRNIYEQTPHSATIGTAETMRCIECLAATCAQMAAIAEADGAAPQNQELQIVTRIRDQAHRKLREWRFERLAM